ncbi:MAG TPA: YegS/Rv2252/BmrU family lipid kinase [Terriglobales bacterium]|jgi:YegS/Rv2252/BmrU family lipid kinase
MRKAILLYNPLSGRRQGRRVADVEAAAKILRDAGVEISTAPTRSSAEAGAQAREAISGGCDTVFACGGDGTIHDVLQGLVGTDAALGIIPLGTANALAHDLKIPISATKAAEAAMLARPARCAVGNVEFQDFSGHRGSRYFTVAAGIGVDAHLFYNLTPAFKKRHGMAAYYAKAWHLWATHTMPFFHVEWNTEAGQLRKENVTELLAVRIANFGGVLRSLAPGASLDRQDLRLVLCKTANRTAYLHYVFQGLCGFERNVRGIELAYSSHLHCSTFNTAQQGAQAIYIEADGELLGTLPATITMVPDAFNLLVSAGWKSS